MSPIFVRPVREQLEHDRLIRFLQAKHKRKYEVAINLGEDRVAPVKSGQLTVFPDLVLTSGRKIAAIIEVESAESVNNLEAMAQWVHFSRARVPFHLYVPVQAYDVARRLSDANQVSVAEMWTYRQVSDGFDLVRMVHETPAAVVAANRAAKAAASAAAKPAAKSKPATAPAKKSVKPIAKAKPAKAKPVAKPKGAKPKKAAKAGRKR